MDISRLGVRYVKRPITAMAVCSASKELVKHDNIIHQMKREFLDIFFVSFPPDKFFIGFQQIINADNIFKTMAQLNFHNNSSIPPD